LDLRYNQNLKFREMSGVLKEPMDTIKTRHRRALAYLKKLLS
jgi:DNA-directed RNA polymerase specialized sigma24 family protein